MGFHPIPREGMIPSTPLLVPLRGPFAQLADVRIFYRF
jgi:hypothetical protein